MNASSAADVQVFDRPLHLAGVLDNAADELNRTWFGYEWNDRTRCNCGIVAAQVLQTNAAGLKRALPPIIDQGTFLPSWRAMTETYCSDSGLPRNEVFSRLLEAGLRPDDFSHLEELSHPQILTRMTGFRRTKAPVRKSRKTDVIAYLRTWAEGIEEFQELRKRPTLQREEERAPVEI
jgi:hypothetical protein